MRLGIAQIIHHKNREHIVHTVHCCTYNMSKTFKSFTILFKSNTDKSVKTKTLVSIVIFGN